ncbi:hypothetical protein ACIP2Y_45225 [Streptomyces sviceus]|uniref:hypothetical protein n=1 Tax=Streptomyces sviceus TaxID=285530 RepID=UPI00381D24CD
MTSLRAPLSAHLTRLHSVLPKTIPRREIAQPAGNCSHTPFKIISKSPGRPGDVITATEVAALRSLVLAKGGWQGRARLAGVDVRVLALASDTTGQGALLVLVRTEDTPIPGEHVVSAQALWVLVTAYREGPRGEALPGSLAASRAAAAARAVTIAELRDAHAAALTTLLGVLCDRTLDDTHPRARAGDLAVSALAELRSRVELDRVLMEERAGEAFARLTGSPRRILRVGGVQLEPAPPYTEDGTGRLLPVDVTHTALAVVPASRARVTGRPDTWSRPRKGVRLTGRGSS